eukprot:gene1451-2794_t
MIPTTNPILLPSFSNNKSNDHNSLSVDVIVGVTRGVGGWMYIAKRKRRNRLKELPVHRALLGNKNSDETVILELITIHPHRDSRGKRFRWVNSVDIVLEGPDMAVEEVLEHFREYVEVLADAKDDTGRSSRDIAGSRGKDPIYCKFYLFERYELKSEPPEHRSATSLVLFATDHGQIMSEDAQKQVALKFMKKSNESYNELFRKDAILNGFGDYPYCMAMEAASQSLKRVIAHERTAGIAWDDIKSLIKSLAVCVQHLHGDLKRHGHGNCDDMRRRIIIPSRRNSCGTTYHASNADDEDNVTLTSPIEPYSTSPSRMLEYMVTESSIAQPDQEEEDSRRSSHSSPCSWSPFSDSKSQQQQSHDVDNVPILHVSEHS